MKTYRFLGTASDIGGYPALRSFGQKIELPDDIAADAVRGNLPIIPESQFAALGFTDEELQKYQTPVSRRTATQSFNRKVQKALEHLDDNRAHVEKKYLKELGEEIKNPLIEEDAAALPSDVEEAPEVEAETTAKGSAKKGAK